MDIDVDVPPSPVENKFAFPRFAALVSYFFSIQHTLPDSFGGARKLVAGKLPPKPFGAALEFTKRIATWEALGPQQVDIKIDEDWHHNVDSIIETDEAARSRVEAFLAQQEEAAVTALLDAAWAGMMYDGEGVDQIRNIWNVLAVLAPQSLVERYTPALPAISKLLNAPKAETRRTIALAVGLLGSHPSVPEATLVPLVQDLLAGIEENKGGSFWALGFLLSRLQFRSRLGIIPADMVKKGVLSISTALAESRDGALVETAIEAMGELSISTVIDSSVLDIEKTQKALLEKAKRGHEKSVQTLGYLACLYPEDSSQAEDIISELIKLGESGGVEMAFVAGEALANASAGWGSSAVRRGRRIAGIEWSPPKCNGTRKLLDLLLKRANESGGGGKRRTTVVGLLSAFEFCTEDEAVKERLSEAQQAFRAFLTDRDGKLSSAILGVIALILMCGVPQISSRKLQPVALRLSTVFRMRKHRKSSSDRSYLLLRGKPSKRSRFLGTLSSSSLASCQPAMAPASDHTEISCLWHRSWVTPVSCTNS
jgi:proteasome component ECM29